MPVSVEYQCFDGSPFPVTFAADADVETRWVIDREHAPTAMTPLADSVIRVGRPGAERAYAECGLTLLSTVARESPRANGFDYIVGDPLPDAEAKAFATGLRSLATQHGGTRGVWLTFSLPRVREGCAWLEQAPTTTTFRELAERRAYVWSHTAIAGVLARHDVDAVAALCAPVLGDRAEFVAYQLAQGHPNDTIDEGVLKAEQAVSWPIDQPTLRELGPQFSVDARRIRTAAANRRATLVAALRAELPADQRDEFDARVARLDAFTFVREARARWQLIATGAMRDAVLRRGAGLLDDPADVFFLVPDEYDQARGDFVDAIETRRAAHAHWRSITPPAVIGNLSDPPPAQTADAIRGAPAAPGVATGPARVLLDLADADRFSPGDVLVATATSPAWTPLFALACAVVTDSGDVLSHVAIAAREYGIPCVVGTHVATTLVIDGDSVIVDGDAGTVRVERLEGGGHG